MAEIIKIFLDDVVCDVSGKPRHLVIGKFDGIHLGPRRRISTMVEQVKNNDGIAAGYTFCHTQQLLRILPSPNE
jgi:FAD synthase